MEETYKFEWSEPKSKELVLKDIIDCKVWYQVDYGDGTKKEIEGWVIFKNNQPVIKWSDGENDTFLNKEIQHEHNILNNCRIETKENKMKTEQEIDIIRGKILLGKATQNEIQDYFKYITEIELLIEEASSDNYWGVGGWKKMVFG